MGRFKIPVGVMIFVAIWLLIVCMPSAREIPRATVLYRHPAGSSSVAQRISAELARRLPNDPVAAGWAADASFSEPDKSSVRRVFARVPNDLPTRALWLRTCAGLFLGLDAARKSPIKERVTFWKEAAQIAREGAQSEPRNAFWPAMEASFEFGVGNDNAAYAAMQRAASCSEYNDYLAQTTNARVELIQRQRGAFFEEKLVVFYGVLYPHWSPLRDATDLTAQRALELKRNGEIDRALALEDAVLNLSRVRRAGSDTLLDALIAEDLARKSLEKFLGIPKPRASNPVSPIWIDPAIHGQNLADGWASFARQNGRPELARSAAFVGEPGTNREFNNESYNFDELSDWAQFGMRAPWGGIAALGPILLLVLALPIFAGAALWLAAWPIRWRADAPTRGQVVAIANFSFWLALGLGVVYFAKNSLWFNPIISFEGGDAVRQLAAFFYVALIFTCWLLPVWFLSWKRGRLWKITSPESPRALSMVWNRARKISWFLFAVALLLSTHEIRELLRGTWLRFPNIALSLALLTLLLGALALEWARWNGAGTRVLYVRGKPNRPMNGRARLAGAALWALFFATSMFLVRGLFLGTIPFDLGALAVPMLGFLVGAIYVSWRFAPDHFRWQLAHRALGALLLMWSIAALGLVLGLVPLRAQLNRNFDQRVQMGELDWMRQQAAGQK